jgi:isopenicillin N synthase-like dioxygenase
MAPSTDSLRYLPPFPKDVPTAPLFCISLQKLLIRDVTEIQRLMQACEGVGFFYLDLEDAGPTSMILDDVEQLFQTTVDLFNLPLAEKQEYDFSGEKSYFGYKPEGTKIVDSQGNVDRNENYNVCYMLFFLA